MIKNEAHEHIEIESRIRENREMFVKGYGLSVSVIR